MCLPGPWTLLGRPSICCAQPVATGAPSYFLSQRRAGLAVQKSEHAVSQPQLEKFSVFLRDKEAGGSGGLRLNKEDILVQRLEKKKVAKKERTEHKASLGMGGTPKKSPGNKRVTIDKNINDVSRLAKKRSKSAFLQVLHVQIKTRRTFGAGFLLTLPFWPLSGGLIYNLGIAKAPTSPLQADYRKLDNCVFCSLQNPSVLQG